MRQRRPAKRDTSDLTGLRAGVYLRVSRADKCKECNGTRRDSSGGPCPACGGTGLDLDENGEERSTGTQRRVKTEWAQRAGVIVADEYPDPDMSASRFAIKKNRPEFERMVRDVKAGKLDVLWFWEISRQQRKLSVFADLRDLCREMGVLWVIRDRVADPANSQDMLLAGIQTILAEDESERLSIRVRDGKESAAHKGRPAGRTPYGYRREYDPVTREWARDVPDTWDGDGRPIEDSPAYVVRECYDRVLAGESLTKIRKDLNERGITTSTGGRWYNSTLRTVLLSPTYAALRVYRRDDHDTLAEAILPDVEAKWPPLVDERTFWKTYRLLTKPTRRTTRPGRAHHLLSSVATCAVCGGKLIRRKDSPRGNRGPQYNCADNTCVGIDQQLLDEFVTGRIVAWLADPAVARSLHDSADSGIARQARADADKARAELEEWRKLAGPGMDPITVGNAVKRCMERIAEADKLAEDAELPPVLAGKLGAQARAGWQALDVTVQRQIVAAVAGIEVHPVGRSSGNWAMGKVPAAYRVGWTWKLGPDAGTTIPPLDWAAHQAAMARAAQPRPVYISAALRERITRVLVANPQVTVRAAMRQAGCSHTKAVPLVRRELEEAGRIPVVRRTRWDVTVDGVPQPRPGAEAAAS